MYQQHMKHLSIFTEVVYQLYSGCAGCFKFSFCCCLEPFLHCWLHTVIISQLLQAVCWTGRYQAKKNIRNIMQRIYTFHKPWRITYGGPQGTVLTFTHECLTAGHKKSPHSEMRKKGVQEYGEPLLPIHMGGEQHRTGDGVSHAVTGQKHTVLHIVASLRGIRSLFLHNKEPCSPVWGAVRINNCLNRMEL